MTVLRRKANERRNRPRAAEDFEFTDSSLTPPLNPRKMSVALPLRQFQARIAQPWICTACARSLSRVPRARNPTFSASRRWISSNKTTGDTRQGAVPSMDQMHARYKQKNRTVM
jgi:hypothetical protein